MTPKEPSLTFGIEEEYHLVDIKTRELRQAPQALMDACENALGDQVSPEFFRSQIEIGTRVLTNFTDARTELGRLRKTIAETCLKFGVAPIAASTHPFAKKHNLQTTPKERYQILARDFGGVGRRLAICGMHVHAGIEDPEMRIDLMNQARYFLPHFLMLSTSSPMWEGDDTGLRSYRLAIFHGLPRTGLPQRFSSYDEFMRTVSVLINNGIIEDASKVWWDLRPSTRFPTLEMRITDVTPRMEDALAIAALYVCVLRMLYRRRTQNLSWRAYPAFLIEENRWRAQRYAVSDRLFDFGEGELVAFSNLVDELIELVAEDAEALGCTSEVAHTRKIAREGTSADRQIATLQARLEAGDTLIDAQKAVVDLLISETISGV